MPFVNVFISHSWSYSGHYDKLTKWLFEVEWNVNGSPLIFYNTSVPKDDPIHDAPTDKELSERISERIVSSHVVLCPTGMYSAYSKWIGKELRLAKDLGTPLLAINPWAQERKSSIVLQYAADYVGWRSKPLLEKVWRLRREHFGVD